MKKEKNNKKTRMINELTNQRYTERGERDIGEAGGKETRQSSMYIFFLAKLRVRIRHYLRLQLGF